MGILDDFRDPASFKFSQPERAVPAWEVTSYWDQDPKPKVLNIKGGGSITAYGIGNLAKALKRSPLTIRHWERDKIIPNSLLVKRGDQSNTNHIHGKRRYYTREQIIGLVKIATEEGLMAGDYRSVTKTQFTQRAFQLFRETKIG